LVHLKHLVPLHLKQVTCPPDPECIPAATVAPISNTTVVEPNTLGGNTTLDGNSTSIAQDIIPLKFTVYGLSSASTTDTALLKSEMTGILQMILFELEELEKDSTGLKILNIVAWERRNKRALQEGEPYELMFDVNVVPVEGVNFAPIIIEGIRSRYDSLVQDVRGWTDSEYVTTDFGFEICAHSDAGDFLDCSSDAGAALGYGDDAFASSNTTYAAPAPVPLQTSTNSAQQGMPTMIIVIISVVAVLLCLCIASAIAFVGFRKREDYDSDYDSRGYSDSEGEYTTNDSGEQLAPYNENQRCYVDEEDHNASVLPRSAVPAAMAGNGSVRSSHSKNSRSGYSHHSASKSRSSREKGDASRYDVRSRASESHYSRKSQKPAMDPSVYNIRPDASDPSGYNQNAVDPSVYHHNPADPSVYNVRPNAADPSVYNYDAQDPGVRSQYSRDQFSHQLESLGGNSRGASKKSEKGSVRMDYSVVSELSMPSITGRYA
jgi:hypothetical protein